MPGNSVIGALRVDLGLSSGQFTAGLAKAERSMGAFAKTAAIGFAAVAAAAIAAGSAMGLALKHGIDHADALSKAAQKSGTTVEALSRLEYAARLSDVSLEGLTGALGKLSRSMADAANGKGPAAVFKALGISIKDTQGNLRDSSAVLVDVADKFAKLPDGPLKSAIAIKLFGKAGAELIPLLNSGSAGLKQMADESDRVSATISTKTARAAEHFNDTMTALGTILQGVINKLVEDVLPSLQKFVDWLTTLNPEITKWGLLIGGVLVLLVPVSLGVGAITSAATLAIPVIAGLTAGVVSLNSALVALTGTLGAPVLLAGLAYLASTTPVGAGEDKLVRDLHLTNVPGSNWRPPSTSGINITVPYGDGKKPPTDGQTNPYEQSLLNMKDLLASLDDSAGTAGNAAAKAYAQVIKSAQDRIDQSKIEAQVLGMTAEEADKLRFSQELLSQATADGTKLTGPQTAQLQGLAAGMAAAAEQARVMTDIYSTGQSVFGSFFSSLKSDLQAGQSLWASFGDSASKALNSIADKLISMAANGLFDMLFNAVAGGIGGSAATASFIPGGFVPGLTGPKLFAAGGVTRVPAIFGDNGPEAAVPLPDGRSIPVTLNGGAGGDTFYISVQATSQAQGADIARTLRQVLPGEMARLNRTPSRRG